MSTPDANGWYTINSAPKDGTVIDLWMQSLIDLADGGSRVAVEMRVTDACWWDGGWHNPDGNPLDALEGFTNIRFTNWRPTPPYRTAQFYARWGCDAPWMLG